MGSLLPAFAAVILLICQSDTAKSNTFAREPHEVTVAPGQFALMPCVLRDGIDARPNWLIDGQPYTVAGLPPGLTMLLEELRIDSSVVSKYRTYQCFVNVLNDDPSPKLVQIRSSVGRVTVDEPIVFTDEPKNSTPDGSGYAFFPCMYTGTKTLPQWRINNRSYSPISLPSGHYLNSSGLLVLGSKQQNLTEYQCYFVRVINGKYSINPESSIGVLTLVEDTDITDTPGLLDPNDIGMKIDDYCITDQDEARVQWTNSPPNYDNIYSYAYNISLYTCNGTDYTTVQNYSEPLTSTGTMTEDISAYSSENLIFQAVPCNKTDCRTFPGNACTADILLIRQQPGKGCQASTFTHKTSQHCFNSSLKTVCNYNINAIIINGKEYPMPTNISFLEYKNNSTTGNLVLCVNLTRLQHEFPNEQNYTIHEVCFQDLAKYCRRTNTENCPITVIGGSSNLILKSPTGPTSANPTSATPTTHPSNNSINRDLIIGLIVGVVLLIILVASVLVITIVILVLYSRGQRSSCNLPHSDVATT